MGNFVEAYLENQERDKLYGEDRSPLENVRAVMKYVDRVGATFVNVRRAEIRERDEDTWYLQILGTVSFDIKNEKIIVDGEVEPPTEQEAKNIWRDLQDCDAVDSVPFQGKQVPVRVTDFVNKKSGELFTFKDAKGQVLMYSVRYETNVREKAFADFTYWSDGQVRKNRPSGKIPLWGLETVHPGGRVFIHEGTKSADFCQRLVNPETPAERTRSASHPFVEYLSTGTHIGWHGGAMNPKGSDWKSLVGLKPCEVVIVCDNDAPGRSAGYVIARETGLKAKLIQFNQEFPAAYDLADGTPTALTKGERYIGPRLEELRLPATWSNYVLRDADGKKIGLRQNSAFFKEWVYVSEPQLFVHADFPGQDWTEGQFNSLSKAFGDAPQVAEMVKSSRNAEVYSIEYDPSKPTGIISSARGNKFNVFTPSNIRATNDDPAPFIEFMTYLVPSENDRKELLRWCATLIAKPETRMTYSVLLISEQQGTGKTTLGDAILAPLVGRHNVSFPSEKAILGEFTSWIGKKRLAVIGEIYQGQSWGAYNALKTITTDPTIDHNEKHKKQVSLQNWLHVFACSNSMLPLKMEDSDRRWLIPTITEAAWPHHKFAAFRNWLHSKGGLGAIMGWANGFDDYVQPGANAPITERKKSLIVESRPTQVQMAIDLLEAALESPEPSAVTIKTIMALSRQDEVAKFSPSSLSFRTALKKIGWTEQKGRMSIKGDMTYVLFNPAAKAELAKLEPEFHLRALREWIEKTGVKESM